MKPIFHPEAEKHLKAGEVILFPSSCGWVLVQDATRKLAFPQPIETKDMAFLLWDVGMVERYIERPPELVWNLILFADKPLWVQLARPKNITEIPFQDEYLPVWIPNDPFTRGLVEGFGRPLWIQKVADPSQYQLFTVAPPETFKPKALTVVRVGDGGMFSFIEKP